MRDSQPRSRAQYVSRIAPFIAPLSAGVIALVLYCITLAPTVTTEDSGELIGAAHFFGVAHPPGYPLWTILCGIFLKIFFWGSIAWRANLFSALCSSLAIAVLCRTLILMRIRPLVAVCGALACAFGRVMWSQSVITEVYTLHFLIFALMLWCAVRWYQDRRNRWIYATSLLLGLGLSNHHTIGVTGVALAAWFIVIRPTLLRQWRLILSSCLFLIVGLAPYTYLYVRAQASPPVNWGECTTLDALWKHVSRNQYRSSAESGGNKSTPPFLARRIGQLKLYASYCAHEYTAAFAILGGFGLIALMRKSRRHWLLLWLLLVSVNIILYMLILDNGYTSRLDKWVIQVYFLPLYGCVAVAATFGMNGFVGIADRLAGRLSAKHQFPAHVLICLASVLMVTLPLYANYRHNNMRNYYYAYDHAKNILDSMLPNGLILPTGDHSTFPLIYLTLIEGYRSDVVLADKYGYIDPALYEAMPNNPGKPRTRADRDRIEEWLIRQARRPVYYTTNKTPLVSNANLVQAGILYHLLPDGKPFDGETMWGSYRYRNLEGLYAPRDFGADNILADWEFFQGFNQLRHSDKNAALVHFRKCEEYGRGIPAVFNNIGSVLAEYDHTEDAIQYYRKAAQLDTQYQVPRWNLFRLYKAREQYNDAELIAGELLEIAPDDFRLWGELGFLAHRVEPYSVRTISCWGKSISLNPTQPQIIDQLHEYYRNVEFGEKSESN